jgi:hypothetical protein
MELDYGKNHLTQAAKVRRAKIVALRFGIAGFPGDFAIG